MNNQIYQLDPHKPNSVNTWQKFKNKKFIFITLGTLLAIVILFLAIVTFIPEKYLEDNTPAQTPTPGWQTGKQLIAERKIPPPSKVLEIDLKYNKDNNPKLTISGLSKKNGHVPSILINPNPYVIQLLDINNKIVYQQRFNLPKKVNYDYPDSKGNLHGGIVSLSNFSFAETLPWFDNINQIRILDNNRQIIKSEPFLNVKVINNNSDFRSIRGDELLNNQDKLNINILSPQKAIAATDKVFNIVFIGNGYTDMDAFHADAANFANTFLSFEPYKSYASQIMFHTVDNATDLQCIKKIINRLVVCNSQLVTQIVNNSGVPYDSINVINNSSEYGGSGGSIPVEYNGPYGPVMFVHEFGGHTFGRLLDEYADDSEASNGPIDNNLYNLDGIATGNDGNCYAGNPPASGWNDIVSPTDHKQRCGAYNLNWYAPSQSSVMYTFTLKDNHFDDISQQMIKRRLDALLAPNIESTTVLLEGGGVEQVTDNHVTVSPAPDNQALRQPGRGDVETPQSGRRPSFNCLGACPTFPSTSNPSTNTTTPNKSTQPITSEPISAQPGQSEPSVTGPVVTQPNSRSLRRFIRRLLRSLRRFIRRLPVEIRQQVWDFFRIIFKSS